MAVAGRSADRKSAARPVPFAIEVPDRIPKERYLDSDFYELEVEQLWSRVWQMACRLEEIPAAGDFVEYQIFDQSVVVVPAVLTQPTTNSASPAGASAGSTTCTVSGSMISCEMIATGAPSTVTLFTSGSSFWHGTSGVVISLRDIAPGS